MKYQHLGSSDICEELPNKSIKLLYNTWVGRIILKVITSSAFSKLVGKVLNSRLSRIAIKPYVKKYKIDMNEYEKKKYKSFNDFFTRKKKEIIKSNSNSFISTCSGKVSCYNISYNATFLIKNSFYTIEELIKNKELAKQYENGICIIYRLTPDEYHRYIYFDYGACTEHYTIKGKLHTVKPIAQEKYKVYTENTREISILNTQNFGNVIQIEVGALCVGKIKNYHKQKFEIYEEKGYFEFGGSTIVQLIKKDQIKINQQIIDNSKKYIETKVEIGRAIGTKI